MNDPKIKLVCFDIGGVLVRLVSGWEDACKQAGVNLGERDVDWDKHRPLIRRYESGELSTEEFFNSVKGCLNGITVEQYRDAFDAWLRDLYGGALDLIDELKGKGVLTACLSNTNDRHWQALSGGREIFRGLEKLDYRFASHEIKHAKPDVQAYRAVEEQLKISGNRILFFDDREDNIEGARQAGWFAERITEDDAVAQEREFLRKYKVLP